MTTKDIISAFLWLGRDIKSNIDSDDYENMMLEAEQKNPWFEKSQTKIAILNLTHIIDTVENEPLLKRPCEVSDNKEILIVCAGNIPAVAFHDIMCVILSGNRAMVKLSSNDDVIIPFLFNRLTTKFPFLQTQMAIFNSALSLSDTECKGVIATGSDSSALVFEQYFKNIPHIIRKSRYSCAVITPKDDISGLEDDICLYFGQGCRSISHLFVPIGYDFSVLIEKLKKYSYFANHNKYRNNLDYQKAIMMMNNIHFINADAVLLRENKELYSPIGVVNYSFYKNMVEIEKIIESENDNIQCVAFSESMFSEINLPNKVCFSDTQKPGFTDYADGINILEWIYSF